MVKLQKTKLKFIIIFIEEADRLLAMDSSIEEDDNHSTRTRIVNSAEEVLVYDTTDSPEIKIDEDHGIQFFDSITFID